MTSYRIRLIIASSLFAFAIWYSGNIGLWDAAIIGLWAFHNNFNRPTTGENSIDKKIRWIFVNRLAAAIFDNLVNLGKFNNFDKFIWFEFRPYLFQSKFDENGKKMKTLIQISCSPSHNQHMQGIIVAFSAINWSAYQYVASIKWRILSKYMCETVIQLNKFLIKLLLKNAF